MTRHIFRSRISVLLTVFYWGLILFTFQFPIRDVMANPTSQKTGVILILAIILVFSLIIWFGISYHITSEEMEIWILRKKMGGVKLSQIHSVERTYFALSAPAVSLKRIGIRFGKGQIGLLSPVREKLFIQILQERCPNAKISIKERSGFFYRILDLDFNS